MTLPLFFRVPSSGDGEDVARRVPLRIVRPGMAESGLDAPQTHAADHDTITRIRSGEGAAFDALYLKYYAPLFVFAARLLGEPTGAADVVQDVFVSLWTRRAELEIRPPIRAYLYGAVRNRALLVRRRAATHERLMTTYATPADPVGMSERRPSPDEHVVVANMEAVLHATIAALPERQRLALHLWLDDRLDPPEIAEALGISAVAVRKLLAKAHAKLRAVLAVADA